MKLTAMWKDALGAFMRAPVTEKYPFERLEAPEHLRSQLHWNLSECTGCGLCVKDCPAEAIDVITLDKKAKRFVFRYHIDRCTFCGQCVTSCRKGCLQMANDEWELAALNKQGFDVYYGDEADVKAVLVGGTPADVSEPAAD